MKLECVWIDGNLLFLILLLRIQRSSKPDLSRIESAQFGNKINEAQDSRACGKHKVMSRGLRVQTKAHWALNLKSCIGVVDLA